jgi:hypothetical protein
MTFARANPKILSEHHSQGQTNILLQIALVRKMDENFINHNSQFFDYVVSTAIDFVILVRHIFFLLPYPTPLKGSPLT